MEEASAGVHRLYHSHRDPCLMRMRIVIVSSILCSPKVSLQVAISGYVAGSWGALNRHAGKAGADSQMKDECSVGTGRTEVSQVE